MPYERLGNRRCWYCSKDDPSVGGFQIVDGRLACLDCRRRIARGEQHVVRTLALYRAGRSELVTQASGRLMGHIRAHKDYGETRFARPFGRMLAETIRQLCSEEELKERHLMAVAVPPSSPERDHAERILMQARTHLPELMTSEHVLEAEARDPLHAGAAGREERDALDSAIRMVGSVSGDSIVVVDDIYTSGNSLQRTAAVLREGGADRVYGAVVARCVTPELGYTCLEDGLFRTGRWRYQPENGRSFVAGTGSIAIRAYFVCPACPTEITTELVQLEEPGSETRPDIECPNCGQPVNAVFERETLNVRVSVDGLRRHEIRVDIRREA